MYKFHLKHFLTGIFQLLCTAINAHKVKRNAAKNITQKICALKYFFVFIRHFMK